MGAQRRKKDRKKDRLIEGCKPPENFQHYIDYDAIARDLEIDYGDCVIDGERLIYRCG